jgi:VanZ family protein
MHEVKTATPWAAAKKWLPVVIWAGLIFLFSTDIFSDSNTQEVIGDSLKRILPWITREAADFIHWLVRKLGHFGEFFILAVLLMRALPKETAERSAGLAIALTTLYAVIDELHQTMVPSRSASAFDVLTDAFGGVCGTLWFCWRSQKKRVDSAGTSLISPVEKKS